MANWIEIITGPLEQKKQYRQHKARREALPEPHRSAAKALDRYLMYYAGVTDGDTLVTMMGDAVDLWERAAVDGTSVRAYSGTQWIDTERARLVSAIEDAERGEPR